MVFGEKPYAEFKGDIPNLEYSPGDKHDLEMLRGSRRRAFRWWRCSSRAVRSG
ncbi:hypothetical protein ACFSLT_02665 [Novosphingobium resinovorum]